MATTAAPHPAGTAATRRSNKPVAVKEKQKPVAYVNWSVQDNKGNVVLRSSKGFPLFDNEYLTRAERDLIEASKSHDGSVVLNAELRVSMARDENDRPDLSKAIVTKK